MADTGATATSQVRQRAFELLRQPDAKPGYHQSPEFRALERKDPKLVEVYAEHVLRRTTDVDRAGQVIRSVADTVASNLRNEEARGRCKDLGLALVNLLEASGVWCFAVTGSVRFQFPMASGLSDRYFWVRDEPDFASAFMGHLWVVAPPMAIIDVAAQHQRWQRGEEFLVPCPFLVETVTVIPPVRELFSVIGLGPTDPFHPELLSFWKRFPTVVAQLGELQVTYQPDGIALPEERLEDPTVTRIGGRTVVEFHHETLLPSLRARGLL